MTTTQTISRERLEELKIFITAFLTDPAHDDESKNSLTADVFRLALAGMDSEPVAWIATFTQKNKPSNSFKNIYMWKCDLDHWVELHEIGGFDVDITPLYSAQPAPVAVPDGYALVPVKPTREMLTAAEDERGADWQYAVDIWDSMCRAAMQSDVTLINEGDNHSEHTLDMGKAEPVTAATVPDVWTANADANAALVMLDRIDTIDCVDDERIESVKSVIRRLAAAPSTGYFRGNGNSSTEYFRENAETSTNTPASDPIDHGYRADCECSGCIATARICDELAAVSSVITGCSCRTCRPVTITDMRFVVCPDCGNKRCPRANDHRNACSGSNEPGQVGSAYPAAPEQEV